MSWWAWVLFAYVAAVSIPLAIIDQHQHRLPNKLVVPGMVLALVCGVGELATSGWGDWLPLICGGAYFAGMLVLALIGGMGMGDVKLGFVLGVAAGFVGWETALGGAFAAFVLGGLVALGLRVWQRIRRLERTKHIAFGPFMLAGLWAVSALGVSQAFGFH